MSLASRRFRSQRVPRFSPSGDDQIGTVRNGGVVATRLMLDWFDMVAVRLEGMMTRSGTIIATHEQGEPDGWLQLNGQKVSARLYPKLAEIYGQADDLVTLPDMTNRLMMGAGSFVALNKTAGSSEINLNVSQLPSHGHPVADNGHFHGAEDRGHTHGLVMDSHTHEATETAGEEHVHGLSGTEHDHGGSARRGDQNVAAGSERFDIIEQRTDQNIIGATQTDPANTALSIDVSEAEVTGTIQPSRANIRIHKSQSNISVGETGDGADINVLNPVLGFNFLVKT